MSLDLPNGDPAPQPEPASGRAAEVAALGAALIEALESHLPGARAHAEATGAYAFAIAIELGRDHTSAEIVREAAKLHDVGMVYVPVDVLRKPATALDETERALLDSHIEAGARLARGAGVPEEICEWIVRTRERWDGGGPAGLRGSEIPLESRIIRVACAADLMLLSASREATIAAIRAAEGQELDSLAAGAMIRVIKRTGDQTAGRSRAE